MVINAGVRDVEDRLHTAFRKRRLQRLHQRLVMLAWVAGGALLLVVAAGGIIGLR